MLGAGPKFTHKTHFYKIFLTTGHHMRLGVEFSSHGLGPSAQKVSDLRTFQSLDYFIRRPNL
jgi:hypothetical protein